MSFTPQEIEQHRREWIAALRSGEFKQTNGALAIVMPSAQQPIGFCCLGVACVVAGVPFTHKETVEEGYSLTLDFGEGKNTSNSFLPPQAQEWLGIDSSNIYVTTPDGRHVSVASLNDEGYTFAQIADLVEAKWFPQEAEAA